VLQALPVRSCRGVVMMSKHDIPPISVVMSVYNGERYLREAIESILDQTFEDFEFIIIDDGSTDSSAEIVREYKDKRIRLVQQKNAGLAVALNRGIELAKGTYIARMDADDIAFPERLSIQYAYMEAHPDVDILGGHAFLIDAEGFRCGEKRKPINPKAISRAIEYACPLIHPTYFVRACVYREIDGYRSLFLAGQDYDFLLRAYDMGKIIANVDDYILSYRIDVENSRPARDRYQMLITRIALQLHKQRVNYGHEMAATLAAVPSYFKSVGVRFVVANKCRNFFLMRLHKAPVLISQIMMLMVILSSLFDYELFCASLRGFLYKRASVER